MNLDLEIVLWVCLPSMTILKVLKRKKQFDAMNLNKEALLKAKPDLILAHESQKSSSGKVLDALKKRVLKSFTLKMHNH